MSKNLLKFILTILIVFSIPAIERYLYSAEDGGTIYPVLNYGAGARSLGMGRAYAAVSDDANAIYWNPSGLTQMPKFEATFLHSTLYFTDSYYDFMSVGLPINKTIGYFGLGVARLYTGGIEKINEYGRTDGSPFHEEQLAGFVSYAREIVPSLSLGVTVKGLRQTIYDYTSNIGVGFDAGVMFRPENVFVTEMRKELKRIRNVLSARVKDYMDRANGYFNYSDYKVALEEYRKAMILDPNNQDAKNKIEYIKKNGDTEAQSALNSEVKVELPERESILKIAERTKDVEQDKSRWSQAIEFLDKGNTLYGQGRLSEAIQNWEKALYAIDYNYVHNHLSVGLNVKDAISPAIKNKFSSDYDRSAIDVKFGVGYRLLEDSLLLAFDADYSPKRQIKIHAGAEYWLFDMIAFRAGWDNLGFTGGLGFRFMDCQIDYAYGHNLDLGGNHKVSFTAKFGGWW